MKKKLIAFAMAAVLCATPVVTAQAASDPVEIKKRNVSGKSDVFISYIQEDLAIKKCWAKYENTWATYCKASSGVGKSGQKTSGWVKKVANSGVASGPSFLVAHTNWDYK